ncbi:MAG: amidohydrolase family protein [Desulfomonilaceae bacterium]|nr:amidohydrolase family protein [Desulfomonilaceae bacterium]
MANLVLDGHAHCGLTVPFEELAREWQIAGIDGGAMFSPVEEIYDRYDPQFHDSDEYRASRDKVHAYLLDLSARDRLYPYFFVWNDFVPVPDGYVGIKWHRHAHEPIYRYDARECDVVLEQICRKRLPIVLEEEFSNTLNFIERIDDRTTVIIPHMGGLNGGYLRLREARVFERDTVWVDTALASTAEVSDFVERYGVERIIFGSDYPFGVPAHEKRKVTGLFSGADRDKVLSGNLLRLLGQGRDKQEKGE